ncbi:MAG: hypothetical protein HY578_06835 [Nitrospinae bacterium]|nr:hypothetical protein [Nitrospinota bacterium]
MSKLKDIPEMSRGIRKTWKIKPIQKPHSTKKGKKGYTRKAGKKKIKEAINSSYVK